MEGKSAIKKGLAYTQQMASQGWEIVHQAVSGNVVINERIDRFEVSGKPVEPPVVGVFEVNDDGKITAWRDSFDLVFFQKRMPS